MSQNLKNDLVNIMLLGVLLFGLMLAQDSGWGFLLAGLPLAIWCFKAFAFIQRKWWLAVPFWCALTYLCWQMSLALWIGYIAVSYTHLTLPTIYSLYICVYSLTLQNTNSYV
ncbi:hypothetical protein LK503_23120, partial [Enterobacter hormaechei]|nr:hypothetical protein [Enterobacter hormaechei]